MLEELRLVVLLVLFKVLLYATFEPVELAAPVAQTSRFNPTYCADRFLLSEFPFYFPLNIPLSLSLSLSRSLALALLEAHDL